MRNAYALLGLAFLLVFGGAYLLFDRAYAPGESDFLDRFNLDSGMSLTLSSSAFKNGETIPSEYTCDGRNVNPPLSIEGIPEGTESLVLVMDDPDIPQEIKDARGIEKFDHWAVYNLPAGTTEIEAGADFGSAGLNGRGESAYTGPCPPPEYEPTEHRYIFRLYAISGTLNFIQAPTLDEVEEAAKGSVIEQAELIGLYDRSQN